MSPHVSRRRTALTVALLALAASPAAARAQAFVPAKGEGAVTLVAHASRVTRHLTAVTSLDLGKIKSKGITVDFSVGLGRKFGLSASVPFVTANYNGTRPHALTPAEIAAVHPTFTNLDSDGAYHSALQDFRIDLRYNATVARGIPITPFVSVIQPSHDYEYFAHVAAGRRLREVQVGVYAARLLDPWLPRAFVQGRFAHGFIESVQGISRRRSVLTLEGGYFVRPTFRVFGIISGQITHGGVDTIVSPRAELPLQLFIDHDRFGRENMLNVAAGLSHTLKQSIDVFATISRTMTGINTHAQDYAVSVGASFSFGLGKGRSASGGAPTAGTAACHEEDIPGLAEQLARCVCVKK